MFTRAHFAIFAAAPWRWTVLALLLSASFLSAQEEAAPVIEVPPPGDNTPPADAPPVNARTPGIPQSTRAPGGRGVPDDIRRQPVTVNMVDMDLGAVLQYMEKMTGKPIIRSQSLPAVKINFDSLGPLSYDEALLALESLLALNGVIITDMGDGFLKVTPSAGAASAAQQVPTFLNGSALDLPPSTEFYTKFFRFNYLDAEKEGMQVVTALSSGGGAPVPFPKNNALLVTDMLVNLQRMEEVLVTADKPDFDSEHIFFFTLRHIKAADLAQRLSKLTTGNSGIARYFNNNTTFEADERTNQLIAITHPSNKRILDNLIDELDKDVEPITSSEVFYIKHAQATEIDTLLEEVITGQKNAREKTESAKATTSPESNTAPGVGGGDSLAADAAPPPSPTEGIQVGVVELGRNLQFSDFVTIVADERSNAIVAYGTKSDLIQIQRLIEQIDVLLAQVYIEVLIAEVTLTDDEVSGFSAFSISGSKDIATSLLNPATALSVGGTGNTSQNLGSPFDFTASLRPDEFSMVIREAASNSNVRILSVPNIVTTHNQEANVNVSQSQPIITSSVQNLTTNNTNGTTSNDVQYRDIGIQLTVKPLIGSNGIVQMEIEQIVENVVNTTSINGIDQPIIGKREATSFVSVSDGEVIVLAGLQSTLFNTGDGKIWLFGYLPLIGDLINPESETNERRELMIFIRPTVYFGSDSANAHAVEKLTTLDNGADVATYLLTDDMTKVTREQRKQAARTTEETKDEKMYYGLEDPDYDDIEIEGDKEDMEAIVDSPDADMMEPEAPAVKKSLREMLRDEGFSVPPPPEDKESAPYRSPYRGH